VQVEGVVDDGVDGRHELRRARATRNPGPHSGERVGERIDLGMRLLVQMVEGDDLFFDARPGGKNDTLSTRTRLGGSSRTTTQSLSPRGINLGLMTGGESADESTVNVTFTLDLPFGRILGRRADKAHGGPFGYSHQSVGAGECQLLARVSPRCVRLMGFAAG
jgi:hypothetical protein